MFSLQQLVNTMSITDRAMLAKLLAEKRNPVSALPIELVLKIVSYLPTVDQLRLQCICRQWYSTFTSDIALRAFIASWHPGEIDFTAERASHSSQKTFLSRFRHLRALTRGLPFSSASFDLDPAIGRYSGADSMFGKHLFFRDRWLAFPISEPGTGLRNCVHLRDVVSGMAVNLYAQNRGPIANLVLSNKIVAFTSSSGRLHVRCHATGRTKVARLPSAVIAAIDADEWTVVMLSLTRHGHEYKTTHMRFDWTTGKTYSSELPPLMGYPPRPALRHDVQSGSSDIFCCEHHREPEQQTLWSFCIEHIRYGPDGRLESNTWQTACAEPTYILDDDVSTRSHTLILRATGSPGIFNLDTNARVIKVCDELAMGRGIDLPDFDVNSATFLPSSCPGDITLWPSDRAFTAAWRGVKYRLHAPFACAAELQAVIQSCLLDSR